MSKYYLAKIPQYPKAKYKNYSLCLVYEDVRGKRTWFYKIANSRELATVLHIHDDEELALTLLPYLIKDKEMTYLSQKDKGNAVLIPLSEIDRNASYLKPLFTSVWNEFISKNNDFSE